MKMSIRQIFQGFIFRDCIGLLPLIILSPSLAIATPAIAQSQTPQSQPTNKQATQNITQNIIYVNSQTGSDRPEQTTNIAPFKTITYAISRAKSGQIIQLANGTYSQRTGEKFPIKLPANVTLRGNEANKGRDVIIFGGGLLRTGAGFPQNVAIAFSEQSELRGVTVTNPNARGYGIWIENASPAIANNTFIDNKQDGGLIAGKSTAIVSTNQFFRNGTSGLAIEGEASPDIRGNLFQQTTFGMSIRQEATPQLTENTFTQNQNGLLIQADAKPILRGNAIVNNRSYGLTISDSAKPDLGKPNDNGNNTFQGNGTLDLQNVSRNKVAVIGNQLDIKRVKGDLQLLSVRPPSNLFANIPSAKVTATSTVTSIAPKDTPKNTSNTSPNGLPAPKSDRFANLNQQLSQQIATSQTPNLAPNLGNSTTLVRNNQGDPANNPFWYESVTSIIVRIAPRELNASLPTNTEISASLPPVRKVPPSGEPVNQPIQIAPLANTSLTPQTPARYRVVVPVSSPNAVAQIRQIVPNSFPSRLNGDLVVQIGAYSDRRIAEVQVSRLAQQGLTARIESIRP